MIWIPFWWSRGIGGRSAVDYLMRVRDNCKASLFEDLGDYEKSGEMYMKIADTLRQRGYDVEADMAEASAKEVKKKIKE